VIGRLGLDGLTRVVDVPLDLGSETHKQVPIGEIGGLLVSEFVVPIIVQPMKVLA